MSEAQPVETWRRAATRVAGSDPDGDERQWGPWHAMRTAGYQPQAWCGSKVKRFYTVDNPSPPEADRKCPKCVAALAAGRPRTWRKY